MSTLRTFSFRKLNRPKGKVGIQLSASEDGRITKDRADWLLEALGAKWSHRAGYYLSPKRAEAFAILYPLGWKASRRILASDKTPYTFDLGDGTPKLTLSQALKQVASQKSSDE